MSLKIASPFPRPGPSLERKGNPHSLLPLQTSLFLPLLQDPVLLHLSQSPQGFCDSSRAWGTSCSQTETCLEADFEIHLKDPKSWIEGAGKGWASQAHLSGWSQKTNPFPHRDLPYHILGIWGLVASFPPWTLVQSRLKTVGAKLQCSCPFLLPTFPSCHAQGMQTHFNIRLKQT